MKSNRFICFVGLSWVVAFSCPLCGEKWRGRIFREGDVSIIENIGEGTWGKKIEEKIFFKEDLFLGVDEGKDYLIFGGLLSIAVDENKNIYLLDIRNYRLLKFTKNGELVWQTGKKGQGPGEFESPGSIKIGKDKIVIAERRKLDIFNLDGLFLKSVKIDKSIIGLDILSDNRILISFMPIGMGRAGIFAEYYSSDLKFLKEFPDDYFYGPNLPFGGATIGGGYFQEFTDNKIFFSIPDKYEIREYTLEGKLLRKIRRDIKLKPSNIEAHAQPGISGGLIRVYPSDSSGPCFRTNSGLLVNILNIVEEKGEKKYESKIFHDFFTKSGQFLGSLMLPETVYLEYIDQFDNFYFFHSESFSKIVRCKFIIK